jgi:LysR family transcriptional regulator, hydrogen peroxide-inducible genes activator
MPDAPHPFSLRQLQYAVAVEETGGFRRAAERCRVAQPSLSAQIAQLEGALGVRLFERGRRRALCTPAGEALVARARRVLAEADDLAAAARGLGDPLAGTLRIGVIPTVSPYLLPEVVPKLRSRYPRLTVLWTEDRTESLLEGLRAGRFDAVLLAVVAGMDDVEQEPIAKDPFVLAGSAEHPLLAARRPVRPAELDGARILLLEDGHCFRDQALAVCASASAQEVDFRATSLSTLAQMAAGGAGVTLLPELSLAVENRHGDLAVRRFAEPAPSRTLVLAWRRRSPLEAGLRELAGAMRRSKQRHAQGERRPA